MTPFPKRRSFSQHHKCCKVDLEPISFGFAQKLISVGVFFFFLLLLFAIPSDQISEKMVFFYTRRIAWSVQKNCSSVTENYRYSLTWNMQKHWRNLFLLSLLITAQGIRSEIIVDSFRQYFKFFHFLIQWRDTRIQRKGVSSLWRQKDSQCSSRLFVGSSNFFWDWSRGHGCYGPVDIHRGVSGK